MADYGALVISAKEDEFEAELNGFTSQRLKFAKNLGIFKLVIIVNKMDEVDWSNERYDSILS